MKTKLLHAQLHRMTVKTRLHTGFIFCNVKSSPSRVVSRNSSTCDCGLSNTVKPYDLHIAVCSEENPEDWPRDVGESEIMQLIQGVVDEVSWNQKFKINFCSYAPDRNYTLGSQMVSLLVFPHNKMFSFVPTRSSLRGFLDHLTNSTPLENNIECSDLQWKSTVLVCCHKNKDLRCGRLGPQVVDRLLELEKDDGDIKVLRCSHLGGHRFAGTMVAYPSGNWFGNITKDNVEEVLKSSIKGNIVDKKYFRGNAFTRN